MEGNLPTGRMIPGASYGILDLQNSLQIHNQQHPQSSFQQQHHQTLNKSQQQSSMMHPPMHEVFPQLVEQIHDCDHHSNLPTVDYNKGEMGKTSASEDDEPSFTNEEGANGSNEAGKVKKGWQRMKWTGQMVRLLITAVSYLGEDAVSDCQSSGRRKSSILQKKGKWKSISKVLAERGCCVSPQQCEDKFNDLNKRYKRLTDILGRGTTCKVVENPALLDMMDISNKAKEDARKILSSKHLFYEAMCSYHNHNRVNLPSDPALQRSLQLALRSGDDYDTKKAAQDVHYEAEVDSDDVDDDDDDDDDDDVDAEERVALHGDVGGSCPRKRLKQGMDYEEMSSGNHPGSQECNRRLQTQGISVDMNHVIPEGSRADLVQSQILISHKLQLEERSLNIQAEMLELKRQRFKWLRFSKKKDRELEKMRMENKRMKLENERLQLELKHKELEIGSNMMINQ